jgi:hypothetical protein
VIGDRETPGDDEAAVDDYGPLLAVCRLNPPPGNPPLWLERYASVVVSRHVWPDTSESVTVRACGTEARALRSYATQLAVFLGRGYVDADADG